MRAWASASTPSIDGVAKRLLVSGDSELAK